MNEMKTIKLLFFATLRDKARVKSTQIDIPIEMTVLALKEKIAEDFPELRQSLPSVVISVNREFAFDDAIIPDQAEVAFFPPVSGG
jgi:molybdopterin converting factor subunit 1